MIQEFNGTKYKFFWSGYLSNWQPSKFVVAGITYNCGEQYMMYQKAIIFNDIDTANKILNESQPSKQKSMGRLVKNFDPQRWDDIKYELIKKGLIEKFKQNPELKSYLLSYKGYTIVEASPVDRIWGIGYYENDAIKNINSWGENLLGKILTELTLELK